MKLVRSIRFLLLGLAMCGSSVLAQSLNSSQIVGTVQDSAGAGVPEATVTVTQTETAFTRTVKSSNSGSFTVPDLPLGPYKVQISAPNFRTFSETGVVLQVGSNATVDAKLQIGSVTEEVTVQASGVQVETVSNGIGQVIDQRQVVELPLNGRDPTQLIALAGATTVAPAGDLNSNKNFPTITIAVAGGLPNGVAYVLDGGNHNDVFNNLNLPLPFPDALQEFKSETSSLPAQYGNHASAAINAVTKSGTNGFHGDLFYFVRNYIFNAANFFNYTAPTATAAATKPRDNLKRNQFGGVIGGPIIKDKLFFFAGYQGTIVRSVSAPTQTFTVTQAELNGDFTQCSTTTKSTQNPANFSPQALAIIKAGVPVINDPSNPCGAIAVRLSQNSTRHDIVGRVDYTISPSQSVFARYLIARYSSPVNVSASNILTANQVGQLNQDQALTIGHTLVITPNIVNSIRLTGDRTLGLRQLYPFFDPSSVGINAYTNPALKGFMGISITNGFALGQGGNNPGYFNTVKYQLGDDVSYVHASHSMAFGGQYLFAYMNTVNNRPTNGAYTFAGTVTGGTTGNNGFADFLTGNVSSFSQGAADYENDRWNYVAFYGQDSWKVTKHFTANYGLRWEPYIPLFNVNGHAENFDMTRFTAGQTSSVYSKAPAGLTFPGDANFPGRSYNRGRIGSGFQPRVGFVFDPSHDGTMSIRGGYGLFYDTPQMFFDTRYSNAPPWGQTISLSNAPLANPFANYPGGNPFPGLLTLNSSTTFASEGVYVNTPLNLKPMYLQQWNLSLQKQYKSFLFSATYIGNKTTHLTTSYELDPATYISGTSTGVAGSCGAIPTASLPKAGTACSSTGNTNARRQLFLANNTQGAFYSTIGQLDDGGSANYNGLLISVNRRAKLMNLVANYTWSHCLSEAETTELTGPSYIIPGNRHASYSNCDSDRRQVGNVSLILNAPKFQQRFTNAIVGGWGLSTIYTVRSGGYYTVTTGADNALSGITGQLAIRNSNPYIGSTRFGTTGLITKTAFTSPTVGTYAQDRPLNTIGPGSYELDMALTREFPVYDATKLQFRWEVFNVPNEAIFANPTSALNSTNFGNITATPTAGGDPRIMQFALKYIF